MHDIVGNGYINLATKWVGNFHKRRSHNVDEMCLIFSQVVQGRLRNKRVRYFVTDLAPNNKSMVHKFMVNAGRED